MDREPYMTYSDDISLTDKKADGVPRVPNSKRVSMAPTKTAACGSTNTRKN
jgi:hypothetical protein